MGGGMIFYEDVRELHHYPSGPETAVLSFYLDVDQSKAANLNRGFETAAEDQLKQIVLEGQVPSGNGRLTDFAAERERILRFLRDYVPRGKSLVIFSDASRNLWWQRDLETDLPSGARWSSQPWLRPLLEIIEQRDCLAAVLIDTHRARIVALDATGISELADIVSEVEGRHHTTGTDHIWSGSQMDRERIKHLKWHAKRITEELIAISERLKFNRLVVGGPVEATSVFVDQLPKRLQQMILGPMSIPVDISSEKLKVELRGILERAEMEAELQIVESLITAARKGERAVLGLASTLNAVNEARVYRLVVGKTFHAEGKQCLACKCLIIGGGRTCHLCGGELEAARDLINRASSKVLDSSGRVQVVSGEAAEQLEDAGNIGAALRF
jgi:peptide subunit release factor 1 (eRF1)